MTVYQRVVDGEVVEEVTPIPGGHEDTRLGLAVLEGAGGWRIQGEAEPEPAPLPAPELPLVPVEPAPEVSTDADVRDRERPGRPTRNRRTRER